MKLNNIYIISWFGNDDVRDIRKEYHNRQIDWAFKQNLIPIVLAQDYKDTDYIDGVRYIDADITTGILLPSAARNILLNEFYKSDDDFAFFADNDSILYNENQYSDSINFISLMKNIPMNLFSDIDIIAFANPARTAFKEELSKPIYKNDFVFRRTYYTTGPIHLMKNIAKYHNKKLYYDSETFNDNGNIITCEEHDFCINGMFHDIKTYHLRNVLLYELGRKNSTWVNTDTNRNVNYAKQLINDKYQLELYKFPDVNEKTFNYIGHAVEPDHITKKIRFAHDSTSRVVACEAKGRTDVHFYELPNPMTAPEALDYCITNDLYGIKEMCDLFYKNKPVLLKSHTKKSIQFNWDVTPEIKNIKKIITVPKDGVLISKSKFFSFK